ncbi:hypothetical protein TNCV_4817901 [Trichonephila clavipes]|nr:hypothetical protein TNCV_4817901 [Trichonephila clavipes]
MASSDHFQSYGTFGEFLRGAVLHHKVSHDGLHGIRREAHTSQRRDGLQHKHSCLTRDSNLAPTAPQSGALSTIPDGRQPKG